MGSSQKPLDIQEVVSDMIAIVKNTEQQEDTGKELVKIWNVPTSSTNSDYVEDKSKLKIESIEEPFSFGNYTKLRGTHILENIIEANEPTDTILALSDGKLGAHGIVLAASSPLLGALLSEQKSNNVVTLILPDVKKEIMKILLNMAYTGKMVYSKEEEHEVFDAMTFLFFAEYANLSLETVQKPKEPEESFTQTGASTSQCIVQTRDGAGSINGGFESNSEDTNEDSESSDEDEDFSDLQGSNKSSSVLYLGRDGGMCTLCQQSFSCMTKLLAHMELQHKEAWLKMKASPEELKCLTFCNFCGNQTKSIQVANKCLSKHRMVRCYICFDAIKKSKILDHYKETHTENQPARKVTKCRWCSKLVRFDGDGRYLLRHCTSFHLIESHIKKGDSSRAGDLKRKQPPNDFPTKRLKLSNCRLNRSDFRKLTVVLNRLDVETLRLYSKSNTKAEASKETEMTDALIKIANIKDLQEPEVNRDVAEKSTETESNTSCESRNTAIDSGFEKEDWQELESEITSTAELLEQATNNTIVNGIDPDSPLNDIPGDNDTTETESEPENEFPAIPALGAEVEIASPSINTECEYISNNPNIIPNPITTSPSPDKNNENSVSNTVEDTSTSDAALVSEDDNSKDEEFLPGNTGRRRKSKGPGRPKRLEKTDLKSTRAKRRKRAVSTPKKFVVEPTPPSSPAKRSERISVLQRKKLMEKMKQHISTKGKGLDANIETHGESTLDLDLMYENTMSPDICALTNGVSSPISCEIESPADNTDNQNKSFLVHHEYGTTQVSKL